MTVTYSREVFTATGSFGLFLKLLFRWRGSIYKLIWRDLIIYIGIYYMLSGTYRLLLDDKGKQLFESVVLHCNNYASLIPVTFVLGFYVSLVIQRWWSQFQALPWPDSCCVWISACIRKHDERGRLMRRTIVRYINLTLILTLRLICLPVKKRFPTLDHLVEAGILTKSEQMSIEEIDKSSVNHPKYWMPLIWATRIVSRARKENRIDDDYAMTKLLEKLDNYRGLAGALLNYDWVTIPLVYTQVVTLAVYSFLLSTLFGRQFLDPEKKYAGYEVDLYVPAFTFLQFFFYMGWLKVAEALINPFGEDDDDFDMNWMIDRNLQVSYLIVDEMHSYCPDLIKDQFWDEQFPEMPYTLAAEETRVEPIIGAAAQVDVEEDAEFLPMDGDDDMDEEEDDDDLSDVILVQASPQSHHRDAEKGLLNVKKKKKEALRSSPNLLKVSSASGGKLGMPKAASSSVLMRGFGGKPLLRGNVSKASFHTIDDPGSVGSVESRPSVFSSVVGKFMRRSNAVLLGSTNSLMSKVSDGGRRCRRRHRYRPHGSTSNAKYPEATGSFGRSVSRISNDTAPSSLRKETGTLPRRRNRQGSETEPDIFKMSSASSLHSILTKEDDEEEDEDFSCSKTDIGSMLEADLRAFHHRIRVDRHHAAAANKLREVHSDDMLLRPPAQPVRGITIAASGSQSSSCRQRILRKKLEAVNNLQNEILKFLDAEIDASEMMEEEDDDASELVNSLEEKTHRLRRQLLMTGAASSSTSRRVRTKSSSSSEYFPSSPQHYSPPPAEPTVFDLEAVSVQEHNITSEISSLTSRNNSLAAPSEDILAEESGIVANAIPEPDLCDGIGSLEGSSEDSSIASAAEDSTETSAPTYELELSTIEEQPELGYQSDSSLDGLAEQWAKQKQGAAKSSNLSTVAEEADKEQ